MNSIRTITNPEHEMIRTNVQMFEENELKLGPTTRSLSRQAISSSTNIVQKRLSLSLSSEKLDAGFDINAVITESRPASLNGDASTSDVSTL